MPTNFFFYLAVSFILTHEMDAIRVKEWRMFIGLSSLKEEAAYTIFTALHVPLYLLLFLGIFGIASRTVIWALDSFFVIHLFLHILFTRHPNNQFTSILSWVLIIGAAVSGGIDLWVNVL
ncbi:MAG: DUF6713 family protein [Chloroflexota bacterium]